MLATISASNVRSWHIRSIERSDIEAITGSQIEYKEAALRSSTHFGTISVEVADTLTLKLTLHLFPTKKVSHKFGPTILTATS